MVVHVQIWVWNGHYILMLENLVFDNWNACYEWKGFREVSVWDEHQCDILYYNYPQLSSIDISLFAWCPVPTIGNYRVSHHWLIDYLLSLTTILTVLCERNLPVTFVSLKKPAMGQSFPWHNVFMKNVALWPLLLTWFNFNPSMDKYKVWDEITYYKVWDE